MSTRKMPLSSYFKVLARRKKCSLIHCSKLKSMEGSLRIQKINQRRRGQLELDHSPKDNLKNKSIKKFHVRENDLRG